MLCLASTSPRRTALLAALPCDFEVVRPGPEPTDGGTPIDCARDRALAKALGAELPSGATAGALVLGVDTVVDRNGREFGKPDSVEAAESMLRELVGAEHEVHTGHALVRSGPDGQQSAETRVATARVRFDVIDDARLRGYLATGLWRGKAGGYGIQDEATDFVHLIEGDLDTVIGLSVRAFHQLLVRSCLSR